MGTSPVTRKLLGLMPLLAILGGVLYYQSIMIIQPVDLLDDGKQNMCDSCPDVTVWNGQLVWSCRMDEQVNYGCNLTSRPAAACRGQAGQ